MTETRPPPARERPPRGRARKVADGTRRAAIGDERRVGLWLLPLFVLTAALAATLAGGLAVLYYSQQVASLRAETASARAQLDEAVATVESAVEEATTTIDEQVARVRAQLAQGLPVDSPNDAGVYAIAAQHEDGAVRVGSSFTVFSDENETFLITTYGLIAQSGGDTVDQVEVFVPGQTVTGTVHAFDRDLDLAAILLRGGPLPITEWRPPDEALALGDAVYLVGIGGPDTPTIAEGRVAALSARTIVPTVAFNSFTAGGPLMDNDGRVVGIATPGFRPFGPGEGALSYAVPIRSLCDGLLRCTSTDMDTSGEGGAQADPSPEAPGATAEPGASPPPTPPPRPAPPPRPTDDDETATPAPAPPTPSPEPPADGDGDDTDAGDDEE